MKQTAIVTLFSIVLGVAISMGVYYYSSPGQEAKWYYSVIMALILPLLSNLIMHRITHENTTNNLLNEVSELKGLMSHIEQLSELPKERKALQGLASDLFAINISNNQFYAKQAFLALQQHCAIIKGIASGVYQCTPEEEIFLTKEIITTTSGSIKAVSYQDIDWWCSSEGNSYLNLHLSSIKQGSITEAVRIFIANDHELQMLEPIIKKHKSANVITYILDPSEVPSECLKDFVIYSDSMIREAEPARHGALGKKARFSTCATELQVALRHFEILERLAKAKETQ